LSQFLDWSLRRKEEVVSQLLGETKGEELLSQLLDWFLGEEELLSQLLN
jgi:hypothetical protein